MNRVYRLCGKKIIDVFLAIVGGVFTLPIMLVISFFIKREDGGSIVFKQVRLGAHQNKFVVYKFRTMVENAYKIGGIVDSEYDSRITRVGKFLRKTSLDELPQLINILKGEMSIVGPRPILEEEFEPYCNNEHYSLRFSALPGLFCTVDMDKRASATREEQFDMDADYVSNISLKLDICVFFSTFINVIKQRNVYKKRSER